MTDAQLIQPQSVTPQTAGAQVNATTPTTPTTKPIGFLQDGDGNLSSTRLAFLLWGAGVLVVWMYVSFKTTLLAGIPPEVVTVLGVLMTGKVVQKFGE
jgi:hypothetical protein